MQMFSLKRPERNGARDIPEVRTKVSKVWGQETTSKAWEFKLQKNTILVQNIEEGPKADI